MAANVRQLAATATHVQWSLKLVMVSCPVGEKYVLGESVLLEGQLPVNWRRVK